MAVFPLFFSLLAGSALRGHGSPAHPLGSRCDPSGDDVQCPSQQGHSLIQVHGDRILSKARTGSGQMQSALVFVERLATQLADGNWTGHKTNMSETDREALNTILAYIGLMSVTLETEWKEDQGEVDQMFASMRDCGETATGSLNGVVAIRKGNMTAARNMHVSCRERAMDLGSLEDQACMDYNTYRQNNLAAHPPSCFPEDLETSDIQTNVPATLEKMEQCLESTKTWFDALYDLYKACKDSRDKIIDHVNNCAGNQTDFEGKFCAYAEKLDDVCGEQDRCRGRGIFAYEQTKKAVKVSEEARKADYVSGEKIACLFGVFNATNEEKPGVLGQCRTLSPDPSKYDINFPDIPEPVTCDTMATRPCDGTWLHEEYERHGWYKQEDIAPCSSCAPPLLR